ncbi:hypothetical protein KCP77_07900 [Salmonella enterica subsp. enterica]|nr:hypothetical protein KCP77_07900 [Salmonella enterica subsp. enterica]
MLWRAPSPGNGREIKPPCVRTEKHPAGPRLALNLAGSCAVMMETDYPSFPVADINLI